MMAVLLATRRHSLALTRRLSPHAEQVIERGRLSTATTPTWPHDGQLIRTIISVRSGTGERASSLEQGRKSPRQSSLRGLSLRRRRGEKGPPAARRS
jgi:hypothetical protein